jgi:hypothetical protein
MAMNINTVTSATRVHTNPGSPPRPTFCAPAVTLCYAIAYRSAGAIETSKSDRTGITKVIRSPQVVGGLIPGGNSTIRASS